MVEIDPVVVIARTANIVVKYMAKETCPAYGKKCQKCRKENHFKSLYTSNKHDTSQSRPKKGHKGKRFYEISEDKHETMDDLVDQVQLFFYHDVHFNSINMGMHTVVECKPPDGMKSSLTFKVDTVANGNFMPITMLMKLFPKVSLNTLKKMIEDKVTLFAYNNTPIKQYRTCSVHLQDM